LAAAPPALVDAAFSAAILAPPDFAAPALAASEVLIGELETADAVVRLAPTPDGGMVAVAGRRDVPMGWVLRVAARVRDAAIRFLRASGGPA